MGCDFVTPIYFYAQCYSILPCLGKGSGTLKKISNQIENYFY
ncbi:hypothetical protein CPK_ORF00532 [Chlamydia pneumoniae LPCoLN]|nr:hypothetical protein CPK_ORF00532 [Chlamydia pneumoniae LPCoLN]